MNNSRLFIGNLSYKTSEAQLEELFRTIGEVVSVRIITDKFTNRSKGFGFVEMATPELAAKAIEQLNGKMLDDRALTVKIATPPEQRDNRK